MKKKLKRVFIYFFAVVSAAVVFLLFSAAYLRPQIEKQNAAAEDNSEPYYTGPKSSGLHFVFEGGKGFFVYLDFKSSKAYFCLTDLQDETRIKDMPVSFIIKSDYTLLSGIIDRVGGVETIIEGTPGRYTGEQIVEALAQNPQDDELRINIALSVFSKISKNGFSKEDFVYIIENSGTDLLVPDCFYWQDYIKDTLSNVEVIS